MAMVVGYIRRYVDMDIMDAKAGSKVCLKAAPSCSGTISGSSHQNDHCVLIEWDNGWISRENVEDLNKEPTALELEYQEMQKKLDEATKLIREVAISAKANSISLRELWYDASIELGNLHQALNDDADLDTGEWAWSSSSPSCW